MKVGFHIGNVVLVGEDLERQWHDHLEQARVAQDCGFDFVSVGSHYVIHPFQYFQIIPWLARLAAEVPEMRILTSVILLPLAHPVDMAEQTATIDMLSGGRFIFGAGLGYREVEFDMFDTTLRHRAPRFEESLSVMKRLWTEDDVDHEGRFFSFKGASLSVRPARAGGPPVWVATGSEPATRRAARMGDAPFYASLMTLDRLVELTKIFDDERAAQGLPAVEEVTLAREFSIGTTRAAAIEDGRLGMKKKMEVYEQQGMEADTNLDDFEKFAKETFVLGDVSECVEQIIEYRERAGITNIKLRLQYPGMSHEAVLNRIQLTSKVIERVS